MVRLCPQTVGAIGASGSLDASRITAHQVRTDAVPRDRLGLRIWLKTYQTLTENGKLSARSAPQSVAVFCPGRAAPVSKKQATGKY